jgi:glycosyltransferase involved in cell wall biosynthesis
MRSPNLHVLHVITAFDRGGAEHHLADLIRHQRDCGMQVALAFLRGRGSSSSAVQSLGVKVQPLALRFYGDPRPLIRLRRLIKHGAFDLIHAHMPPAELYARLALLGVDARRVPMLITKHNDERFYDGPGQRAMCRWVSRRASAVIAISDAVHRYMAGEGIDPKKLRTIHYGMDATPFAEARDELRTAVRRRWGVTADELVIGFAGRFVPQKSIDTLLRGFALFVKRLTVRARLALVGRGPLEASLRRLGYELGITDKIIWAGFHDDMRGVMCAFDIFAITSVHEGFGLVLLEAMASARPVVATRAGAIPEILADGETGLLAPSLDAQAVSAALEKMIDPALRARFGEAGRARVVREFTLEKMCRETDALYARCVRAEIARTKEQITCAVSTVN